METRHDSSPSDLPSLWVCRNESLTHDWRQNLRGIDNRTSVNPKNRKPAMLYAEGYRSRVDRSDFSSKLNLPAGLT